MSVRDEWTVEEALVAFDELIDELMDENGYDKQEVLGDDGLLSQLTKRVVERAVNAELTEHLGYELNDPGGNNSGNSRNGTTPKTVRTENGTVELDVRATIRAPSRPNWPPRVRRGWRGWTGACWACTRLG